MIYFEKDHPHRKGLEYVAKAVSKDKEKHLGMLYIKSDGRRIFATDGHRLHLYEPEVCPLANGLYEITEKNRKQIGLKHVDADFEYPNINRIIPDGPVTHVFPPSVTSVGMKLAHVIRAMPTSGLPPDQFADAVSDESVQLYLPGDGLSAVLFEGKNIKALVMPLRA